MLYNGGLNIVLPPNIEDDVTTQDDGRTLEYNGEKYLYNENVTNILVMGIDKDNLELDNDVVGTAGQSDANYLISIDTVTGENNIIPISRDTLAEINVYSTSGSYIGIREDQLCIAYSYGDGKQKSCENTLSSVTRLFYGLPINSYFAFELDAISVLNDLVGGVTLTMIDDFTTGGTTYYKGQTVTLTGDEAYAYLKTRDISQLDSNIDRMGRQMNYLQSFTNQAIEKTNQDITFPLTLYNEADDYMHTNFSASKVTFLASTIISSGNTQLNFNTIEGELSSDDEGYAIFIPDEEALFELMLDLFYTKQ